MEEYASNSHKSKENIPEKKVEKIVSGAAKTKKKGELQKLTNVFISDDAANVKSYILLDVLVPAVKKAISDIVTNGIDIILYGETGRSKNKSSASKISYRSFYERDNDRRRDNPSLRANSAFDYDNIIFDSRGDAEAVLSELENIIEQFGFTTVADLYDLADISNPNYSINRFGWTNLSSTKVVHTRDGYMLKLPKAMPVG